MLGSERTTAPAIITITSMRNPSFLKSILIASLYCSSSYLVQVWVVIPASSSVWQFLQTKTHFLASRKILLREYDSPFTLKANDLFFGFVWWKSNAPAYLLYPHTIHFPPNIWTSSSFFLRLLRITHSEAHLPQRKVPSSRAKCFVWPCFEQIFIIKTL